MKVLLIGLGSIGQRHLSLLRDHPAIDELLAYRHQVSDEFDGLEQFTNLSRALEADPDIAFVTNPTNLHVKTATTCAAAGCDLFIEKPLSHELEGIEELCCLVEEQCLITMVGCQLRFTPLLQRLDDFLVDLPHGDPLSFEAYSGSYLPDWRPDQDYRDSYSSNATSGGGAVLDLIHELDYLYWIFGPFNGVCGRIETVSNLEIDVEDIGVITIRCDDVLGTVHVDYCRPVPRRTLEVVFQEGVVTLDFLDQEVRIETRNGESVEEYDYERNGAFRAQLDHFIESVQSRTETCNPVTMGKDVLKAALDAKSSHQ